MILHMWLCSLHAVILVWWRGLKYFDKLVKDRSVQVREDHYACFVDLCSRAGKLKEAFDYIVGLGTDNGDQSYTPSSSSRWPKVEVEALIKLRTSLDSKYQENGPKGPLWEEISAAMKKLGYNRNSKRCKEKWENINKYFKKVKESNKKRREDSKTCPYYHQLDALYRERYKFESSSNQLKPENSVPLMVRPEQQWPPPPPSSEPDQHQHEHHVMEDIESDQNQDEDEKDGDDEEEDEGGDYEIVASKPVSMGGGE